MPTIVYQGLQSCFESQFIETTTTLKLKVATKKAPEITKNLCIINNQEINNKKPSNLDLGGWNFIQSLSNISSTPKEENEKQKIQYVHPSTKSSPKLSQKSLELCTENLGSETGSDTMDISILSFKSSVPVEKQKQPRQIESRSKIIISRDFPPPLTTIRNSNLLQVKPHREDGRLIIKAVETTSKNAYFHAERSNGRLMLSFSKDNCVSNLENSEITNEENEDDIIDDCESDQGNEEYDYDQECEEEEVQEENDLDAEVEIGMEKFQRPRRCNENGNGNKGLCNWKPLWVATS